MITTVTSSVGATTVALASNQGFAAVLSLVTMATFVFLLVTREMVGSAPHGWLARFARGANIAIYPLGAAFLLIIWDQFQRLLS